MVSKGANVNHKNDHGETPLHTAAFRGKEKSVMLLLLHRADPNITNKYVVSAAPSAALGA